MGARTVFAASVFAVLTSGMEKAFALDEQTNVQNLPAIEVSPPAQSRVSREQPRATAGRARNRTATQTAAPATPKQKLYVYPTAPGPGGGIDVDKIPASINAVDSNQIKRTRSPDIAVSLQQYVPGLSINEVTGNPFQPDIQFRGFVASPLAGTPQGLAVYQNGVRINEAFADIVNWDLIPTAAIRSAIVVTNNPAFGLNALGGAIDLQMKNGFNYQGAEVDVMGGSFGRLYGSAQWGKKVDSNWAVYGALEGVHDNGFRNFSSSDIRRFYGDIGYRYEGAEFHASMGAANNALAGPSTVPAELLQKFWGATYTTPQTITNKVGYLNLTGKVEATPTWTLEGIAHVRRFDQRTVDGNPTDTERCSAPVGFLCFGDDTTPAFGVNGQQLVDTFPPDSILAQIDRTSTRSTSLGVSGQATNSDQLFGHENRFVMGVSYDASTTRFNGSSELGTLNTNYVVSGSGVFLGRSGDPTSIGPVSLRTVNKYQGIYALDTFNVTERFAVTGGGRFNAAQISLQDQLGTALNGDHSFTRFNPIVGGTFKITSEVTAYAGYSEANRIPTPLELGCADPANPCLIGQFLIADPPLKQVVSKTFEAGFRGTKELNIGSVGWKIGAFRATNYDDILPIPIPGLTGFGFFQNVGNTRRQGIETEVSLKSNTIQFQASYAFLDARFLDALQVGSDSPFADADGNIQILPGNQIPRLPRHLIKANVEYAVTDAWKVGGDALFVSSQYFVGDESNQFPKLPSYAVFNLHTSYQINKTFQIYGRVNNVFDSHYSTLGTFFDREALPNFANGGAEFADPRSLSPARPRAFYAGLRAAW